MQIKCEGCHKYYETVSMDPHDCHGESIAFKAGREARANRTPLTKSALRALRPGSRQYDDYIDGYDYETEQRRRKRTE